jgi:hypothetical protein
LHVGVVTALRGIRKKENNNMTAKKPTKTVKKAKKIQPIKPLRRR